MSGLQRVIPFATSEQFQKHAHPRALVTALPCYGALEIVVFD